MLPVFIPSKGRAGQSGTWDKLTECKIPYTVVVEPQDYDAYCRHHPPSSVVCLPSDNRGVHFARNYILEALAPLEGWYWCIDDDVQVFYGVRVVAHEGGREPSQIVEEIDILTMMDLANPRDALLVQPDTCLIGIEYECFLRQLKPHLNPYMIDSYANVCVCLNKALLPRKGVSQEPLRYRWPIREDYDMCLQIIAGGKHVFRYRCVGFRAPQMGTKPGGMTAFYHTKKDLIRECNRKMIEEWGEDVCTEVVKGTGVTKRFDLSIRWKYSAETAKSKKRERDEEKVAFKSVKGWKGWTVLEEEVPDADALGLTCKKTVKVGDVVCMLVPRFGAITATVMECHRKSKSDISVTVIPDPSHKGITQLTMHSALEDLYEIPQGGVVAVQRAISSVDVRDVGVVMTYDYNAVFNK